MWTYAQKSGNFLHNGTLVDTGYSGFQEGKNNPTMQAVECVGPIPRGGWIIEGPPVKTPKHGPYVLTLTAAQGTQTFGRSGFLMHGESISDPGNASRGCIIMSRVTRELVWNSNDRDLEVVPEFATEDLPAQDA